LTDAFSGLDQENVKILGTSITVIDVCDKIQGFQTKFDPWNRRVPKEFYTHFPIFDNWKVGKNHSKIYDFGVEKR